MVEAALKHALKVSYEWGRIEGKETMKNDSDWKSVLTPEQYNVTRRGERARILRGTVPKDRKGTYHCICCGKELVTSDMKYQSSCVGHPFTQK